MKASLAVASVGLTTVSASWWLLDWPANGFVAAGMLVAWSALLCHVACQRDKVIVRLGGLSWTRWDFCRHFLLSGDTGSGKTRSAFTQLLYQLFLNEPAWGGLCIDDKGCFWETLAAMAKHFGREKDLVVLRVGEVVGAAPAHRFNLTSDRSIPFQTYGRIVVDTAVALGQKRDQTFFRQQAQTHVAKALEALHVLKLEVTLENACNLIVNETDMHECIEALRAPGSPQAHALADHFQDQYVNAPPEQRGGVAGTVANYLQCFLTPEIAEVFARDNTFQLSEADQGKIICLALPQEWAAERRYISTFLKQLFYLHILRRFDKSEAERRHSNLLVLWADEAQHFVTASEEGMSDYNVIDRIRDAHAAVVMATQSSLSFVPPLGKDKAKVLTLNLRNRVIFKATDEEDALASADFIGKKKRKRVTRSYGRGGESYSVAEDETHKIKAHLLRRLRKHHAVVVHCEGAVRRRVLPPIEPDGTVSPWFRRTWFT